jgi:hypothetical protein
MAEVVKLLTHAYTDFLVHGQIPPTDVIKLIISKVLASSTAKGWCSNATDSKALFTLWLPADAGLRDPDLFNAGQAASGACNRVHQHGAAVQQQNMH